MLLLSYSLLQIYHLLTAHKPKDVWKFFDTIILQAEDLQVACSTMISTEGGCPLKPPVVTVGLATLNCIVACGHCIMELSTFLLMGVPSLSYATYLQLNWIAYSANLYNLHTAHWYCRSSLMSSIHQHVVVSSRKLLWIEH